MATHTTAVRYMAGELTQAIVDRIEDGVAVVLVGLGLEEWDFPAHLLPPEAVEGSVLLLEGDGRDLHIVGVGSGRSTVEQRLGRGLSRKRPIRLPLPQREMTPEIDLTERPSRHKRDLGT